MMSAPKKVSPEWAQNWMTSPPEDYTNVITFDLSPEDLAIIEARAKAAGLTVEGYLRACALDPKGSA